MSYMTPAMAAHLWAHQTENSGQGGSLYFTGKDIFSFGSHFRCASVETNQRGEKAYLVTTRKYSNTTAKHMCKVRGAIPIGARIFNTPRTVTLYRGRLDTSDYREAAYYLIDQLEQVDTCIQAQARSRSQNYSTQVEDCLLNMGRWIEFWGLDKYQRSSDGKRLSPVLDKLNSDRRKDIAEFWHGTGVDSKSGEETSKHDRTQYRELLADILSRSLIQPTPISGFGERVSQLFIDRTGDAQLWEHFEARQQQQEEINRQAEERRESRRAEQRERWAREAEERNRIAHMTFEEKKGMWYSGELASTWFSVPSGFDFNALLRVRKGCIETSMGVCVETAEAERLWKLVEHFHRNEADFRHDTVCDADNHQWSINSYHNDILTAGCHRICYDEMRTAALQLGIAA